MKNFESFTDKINKIIVKNNPKNKQELSYFVDTQILIIRKKY